MLKISLFGLFLISLISCNDNITNIEQDVNEVILFYGSKIGETNIFSAFTMNMNGSNITKITKGSRAYPTWFNYPNEIILFDVSNYNIENYSIEADSNNIEVVKEDIGNILFLRYSKNNHALLFSFQDYTGLSKIAYFDFASQEISHFPLISFDSRNPIWSEKDDWIYFSGRDDISYNIYRITKDGSTLQYYLKDDDHDLITFDLNFTSEFLAVSRFNENISLITIYDIQNRSEMYNIDVSSLGMGLYPSFTADNKKILFVNGVPNDYSSARNVYIVNIDGTDLRQLTFSDDYIYSRPLNW